jgi:hypothetical protein
MIETQASLNAWAEVSALTIKLAEICVAAGGNLGEEIDKKAVILRSRIWVKDGTGCGRHIEEKPNFSQRTWCCHYNTNSPEWCDVHHAIWPAREPHCKAFNK